MELEVLDLIYIFCECPALHMHASASWLDKLDMHRGTEPGVSVNYLNKWWMLGQRSRARFLSSLSSSSASPGPRLQDLPPIPSHPSAC